MDITSVKKVLQVEGMTCASCELRIENGLKKIDGLSEIKVSLSDAKLYVTFDANEIGLPEIIKAVEKIGYKDIK